MSPKSKRLARRLAIAAACLAVLALLYLWRWGTPSGDADWSPNRRYYVQRYINLNSRMFEMRPPGDGSNSDGYVRVYDRGGRLLRELYYRDNVYVQPLWFGATLWLNEDSVALPTTSE